MVPPTRRRLLHGAAALAVGLAGCEGTSSTTSHSNDPRDAENVETDPDSYALRNPENEPVAWIEPTGADGTPPTPRREGWISDPERGLVADEETAGRLGFADVDGTGGVQAFVDATDFGRETLLLETRTVDECYRLELCGITWSAASYRTYYGRTVRPADVACRVDAVDRVARLIRIPDVLDPEEVTGRGSASSSGGCYAFRRRFERRAARSATPSDDASTGAGNGPGSAGGR